MPLRHPRDAYCTYYYLIFGRLTIDSCILAHFVLLVKKDWENEKNFTATGVGKIFSPALLFFFPSFCLPNMNKL